MDVPFITPAWRMDATIFTSSALIPIVAIPVIQHAMLVAISPVGRAPVRFPNEVVRTIDRILNRTALFRNVHSSQMLHGYLFRAKKAAVQVDQAGECGVGDRLDNDGVADEMHHSEVVGLIYIAHIFSQADIQEIGSGVEGGAD